MACEPHPHSIPVKPLLSFVSAKLSSDCILVSLPNSNSLEKVVLICLILSSAILALTVYITFTTNYFVCVLFSLPLLVATNETHDSWSTYMGLKLR